jgi:ferrous iron transport protein A
MKTIPLTHLKAGEKGIIVEIIGGKGVVNRLCSLGIMPGKVIVKISAMVMRGPVVVQVGRTQLAIGFGMARKVIVKKE